jgi:hypothetical protein
MELEGRAAIVTEEERAIGRYYYLEDKVAFPSQAKCIVEKRTSPLQRGEVVEVIGMTPEEDSEHDMLVDVQWQGRQLAMPFATGRHRRRRSHPGGDWRLALLAR